MKKILLFIFLFSSIVFSQYGANRFSNGNFDSNITGWTGGATTLSHYSTDNDGVGRVDLMKAVISSTGANRRTDQNITDFSLSEGTVMRFSGLVYMPGGNTTVISLVYSFTDGVQQYVNQCDLDTSEWVTAEDTAIFGASKTWTVCNIYFRSGSCVNTATEGDSIYLDNLNLRQKLSILYIDTNSGNDTNEGNSGTPIATLGEAETRGFYSGGTFNITAGTYDETWTIGNNTTLVATGNVTITTVNFASKTCTVDCRIYNNIGTIQNAENIIVDTSLCGYEKRFLKFPDHWRYKRH